ncbi:MAG: hypothetical protein H6728_10370 [Myxococcales bacterium]|nr:hypothetical protein [Myxococcales bacterium]MCB9643462.1 hypothetical protein [Myxococcales bacterium]
MNVDTLERNVRSLRWVRLFSTFTWLLLVSVGTMAWAQDDDDSSKKKPEKKEEMGRKYVGSTYKKPLISFLGSTGIYDGGRERGRRIEELVRKVVEGNRFVGVKIPTKREDMETFVRKMVRVVSQRSKGRAQMQAEWDSSFRGFNITAKMLNAIQNLSFFYWLDFVQFQPNSVDSNQFDFQVDMVVYRLEVFDCRDSNRNKGEAYKKACEGKQDNEYGGIAKPYKVFKARSSKGEQAFRGAGRAVSQAATESLTFGLVSGDVLSAAEGQNLRPFERGALRVGRLLKAHMALDEHFGLYNPVEYASFSRIKFGLGKAEGLKLNRGFDVYVRTTSGKLKYRGYVRVRSIGDNRMKMEGNERVRVDPNAPLFSEADQIIVQGKGGIMKGMLMYEHPYRPWTFYGGVGLIGAGFSGERGVPYKDGVGGPALSVPILPGGVMALGLQLGGSFDISSQIGWDEMYVSLVVDMGFSMAGKAETQEFIAPVFLHAGLMKRFYFRQIAFVMAARVGLGMLLGGEFLATLGGELMVGVEYLIKPELSLFLHAGVRAHWVGWDRLISGETDVQGAFVAPNALLGVHYSF